MKKVIITAGGTSEKIDNVRKITNSSSCKLGLIMFVLKVLLDLLMKELKLLRLMEQLI